MNSPCEEFQMVMAARLADSTEVHLREEISRHLEECPTCREYLAALQADDELLTVFTGRLRASLSRLEDRTIQLLQEPFASGRRESPHAWRRNVCATMAAAVVLCVVVGLAIRFFGWTGVSSVGLARTLEAMQGKTWVHSVQLGPVGRGHEWWQRWDGRVIATKSPSGAIRYTNYAENVGYEYNQSANKVTISLIASSHVLAHDETPLETAAQVIRSAEEAGAKIKFLGAGAPGTKTETIRVDYPDGRPVASIKMTRNTATDLLLQMEWTSRKEGREVVTTTVFDYPDPGPADIYALGVPADAVVYDTRPTGPVMTLVKRIQERFERGFGDHQAILLESEIENDVAYRPMSIAVFRQKGQRKRWDYYHAFNFRGLDLPYPGEDGRWPRLSMPQMLDIISTGAMKPVSQMLFDGSRTVTRDTDRDRTWVHEQKADEFKIIPYPVRYLASLAWPNLYLEIQGGSSTHVKTEVHELPADPNRPGWVGLRLARFAQTQDYWFDPARDDLLMERITTKQCVGTQWESVKEVGQTATGVWYPRVIAVKLTNLGPDGVPDKPRRGEKRILLENRPVIDDALFDPATLTR